MSAFEDELHWELSWLVRAEVPARAVRLTVRDLLVARMERGRLGARQVSENVQTTVRVAWRLVEELDAPEDLVETVCRAALDRPSGRQPAPLSAPPPLNTNSIYGPEHPMGKRFLPAVVL